MKKYYIFFIAMTVLTLGLVGLTITKGLATKSDKITEKAVQDISRKLNDYINDKKKLPENLGDAGVNNAPGTVKYEKQSDSTYRFCATFKKASSYESAPLLTSLFWGGAIRSGEEGDSLTESYPDSDRPTSSLYMYSHKAGENCQTVTPYQIRRSTFNNDIVPQTSRVGTAQSGTARDTERKTDINSLHGQLEAYYAQKGNYPSRTDLNNSSWRATNMRGLDSTALRDPAGTLSTLSTLPAKNIYSYQATKSDSTSCEASGQLCTGYTLTATLENGTSYQKKNLN